MKWLVKQFLIFISKQQCLNQDDLKSAVEDDRCQGCIFQIYVHGEYCLPQILDPRDLEGKKWKLIPWWKK